MTRRLGPLRLERGQLLTIRRRGRRLTVRFAQSLSRSFFATHKLASWKSRNTNGAIAVSGMHRLRCAALFRATKDLVILNAYVRKGSLYSRDNFTFLIFSILICDFTGTHEG
jgi:hypothetical protein